VVDGGQRVRQVRGIDCVEDKWVVVLEFGLVPALGGRVQCTMGPERGRDELVEMTHFPTVGVSTGSFNFVEKVV
jgi:hypothetical protein